MKSRSRKSAGFTLVELMIAMALGLVMISAAISFALNNNRSWQINDSLARIQENAVAALDILSADLRLAGYHSDALTALDVIPANCLDPQTAAAACSVTGIQNQSDVLMIQYQVPAARPYDCTGRTLQAMAQPIINIYSIQDPDGDGINTLYCRGYSPGENRYISNNTPLVDGIDALRVRYRVSRHATAFYYSQFNQLSAEDLSKISAVTLTLLVSNGLKDGSGKRRFRRYLLPGNNVVSFSSDSHYRQLFETTVTLNNQREALSL